MMSTPLDKVFFNVKWPENRPFQIVGFGLNAVDWVCIVPHYPEHNTKIQMEALFKMGGGQVATAAAMCARYGMRVRYVGRVGDDEIGQFSLDDMRKEPMEVCVDVVPDAFSQFSVIIVDRVTGERTIIWDRDPKLHYLDDEIPREYVIDGQLLHIDGHDQAAAIKAARWARAAGMKVSIDIDKVHPGVEELLELVDFVLPSQHFAMQFAGTKDWKSAMRTMATVTKGFIGVTCGSAGSAALWEDEIIEIPGIKVQAVDTTGAGDVFHGGFAYGLFQNWSVERCLRFANVAGALSCTKLGARASIPTLEDIVAHMCE
ncbi:MAG: carbohydrate kinase family protein [Acidobacteria bacterium]|nr:MAG: carbohydrate kinase family protein [Acidobacteriota bacterium]